jgi:hypothetical protein
MLDRFQFVSMQFLLAWFFTALFALCLDCATKVHQNCKDHITDCIKPKQSKVRIFVCFYLQVRTYRALCLIIIINVECIHTMILNNQLLLSGLLQDFSHGSAHKVISRKLGFNKISARWI